ncbi:methyltransferase domain-containing protein [Paenibacillus sp. LMG 31461]|uniref:Methyltransferase domain-containing protein n=1 Tax=Paenibacillus plantarum TaxID=2654975 RepID=A0ABX1XEL1_9BACL|nr:class I SAM-dependent methyltransferase [Paenibacillus plantarum]NOU66744.1 methyltransferase domain-containing protein [Paenibacillus plantarum]
MNDRKCRFCNAELTQSCVNLGMTPLSNSYLHKDALNKKENYYPLHAYVCGECFLVQLEKFESAEHIFSEYAYFSSYSDSWLEHARHYVDDITSKYPITSNSLVVEIASNDGYLLQYFKEKNIPVLGVEPAANVAKVAQEKGIPTYVDFFGRKTAAELALKDKKADLLIGNNVLAHVPDLHDFVGGMTLALKANGIITMEFPYLLRLMSENQFDTIYHEHFSYFSLVTVMKIFASKKLTVFDVQELPTHGGSIRIYAQHEDFGKHPSSRRVDDLLKKEEAFGMYELSTYTAFAEKVKATKRAILEFFTKAKNEGKTIVGYGAPAKGNTLLNYCGVGVDFIDYTVDRSPHKQGLFLPGTHIPIYDPNKITETKPDYVFILPWNLKDEISKQMKHIYDWGGRFVVPIPEVEVF